MTEFSGPGAATAATPGAKLASVREAAGLSIADVAGQMRISPRQVQAIEADQYEQLPGAVFVRGFVRNYARLLGLDPVPLLHALEPALGQDVPLRAHEISGTLPVPVRRASHVRLWVGVFSVVFVAVVAAGAYELWRSRAESPGAGTPPAPKASPPPAASAGGPAAPAAIALTPERLPDQPDPGAAAADAAVASPAAEAAPDAKAEATAGVVRIGMEFAGESWVEIRQRDGKVIYSGTGQPNTARSVEAHAPIEVVIGNASAVRITYNGRPFDVASHATRNIARFTLE